MSVVKHKLEYLSGLIGFGSANDVPHWYCTCGQWRVNRSLRTGSPMREAAAKQHRKHVKDAEQQ